MDRISKELRSWNMSRIRGRDTAPELAVRSMLHKMGYRFRVHRADLPGKPDIVLPRFRCVIFVHGCFWHRHPRCKYAYTPKSRQDFWNQKFHENMARDRRNTAALRKLGWHPVVIWECECATSACLEHRITAMFNKLGIPIRQPPVFRETGSTKEA